ncbi:TfuA-like protein [Synechococcus sp. A10-1-5-1]|uniref:TfuA-like protein n=1 Tax=Synechococcus sp. A10-1-5-1 TaxID=2936507 RepID=UPI002001B2E7|nr:TfuA-like protein [Synechococcus sp. A10-1-5-1]UPM50341.1 TfuA-like protein [Synechococcus sp. A10-1-5-1]
MKTVLYAGPSLSNVDQELLSGLIVRGPCKQADLFADIHNDEISSIIIADGLYKTIPAPWHKEILFAIENKKRVIGVSSIGALRAAELSDFGMIGFGKVYQYFCNDLRDDSDVALLHHPESHGWTPTTMAFVDLFFHIRGCVDRGLIAQHHHNQILEDIRACNFEYRTPPVVSAILKNYVGSIEAKKILQGFSSQKSRDLSVLLTDRKYLELKSNVAPQTLSWTPFVSRQLSKDIPISLSLNQKDHANTISNFTSFCFLRYPEEMNLIYQSVWAEMLMTDSNRIEANHDPSIGLSRNKLTRSNSIPYVVDQYNNSSQNQISIYKNDQISCCDGLLKIKDFFEKNSSSSYDFSRTVLSDEFNHAYKTWLKSTTKLSDDTQIHLSELKHECTNYILSMLIADDTLDVQQVLGAYKVTEFFSLVIPYRDQARLLLSHRLRDSKDIKQWLNDWEMLLQGCDDFLPHSLYQSMLSQAEIMSAAKKINECASKYLFPIRSQDDYLKFYYLDLWQLINIACKALP